MKSEKKATEELKAINYANEIFPDLSEYIEWKKIKEAYLKGWQDNEKLRMDNLKDVIRNIE